jgi:hypothetical protein
LRILEKNRGCAHVDRRKKVYCVFSASQARDKKRDGAPSNKKKKGLFRSLPSDSGEGVDEDTREGCDERLRSQSEKKPLCDARPRADDAREALLWLFGQRKKASLSFSTYGIRKPNQVCRLPRAISSPGVHDKKVT